MVQASNISEFQQQGFTLVPHLFSPEEVEAYKGHYMALRQQDSYEGDFAGVDTDAIDPLKRFPRMIHMHRWDALSLDWLTDKRLDACMTAFLGESPFAVQTMIYFKPPGSRGQALHQDNFYLKVQPGTCLAAWLALDDCDEENGCLQIVPGTHDIPELCPEEADISQSFTDVTVPLASGMQPRPVLMKAGDVLFFNGQLVHGSFPNTSRERFRRALIGHYIVSEAAQVAKYYHPVLRMDQSEVQLEVSEGGSECGVWEEQGASAEVKQVPLRSRS
jgi:ectoine hydroxylase-related dioxygenase (phytanoyl-CoA dioxygenase family)